jgi:hypothetical protein
MTSAVPGYEFGYTDETHEEFTARLKRNVSRGLVFGVIQGWWEDVDSKKNPIPFPIIIKKSKLTPEEKTMAHVLTKAKVFDSIGEAKRAGWNKPIQLGEFWFKNKTVRIQIHDE